MQFGTPEDLTDISSILDWMQSIGSGEKEAKQSRKKFQERLETLLQKGNRRHAHLLLQSKYSAAELTAQAEDELITMQKRAN